jgi:uncharacterized protein (TIGR02646 family)
MRYFQRQPLDAAIQNQLSIKTSTNFGSLTDAQRSEIVLKLIASQKALCVYCECEISLLLYHIEHFEEQHDAPNRIFDYTNLILSCEGNRNPAFRPESTKDANYRKSNISCGHRKTKTHHGSIEIDYHLLLNPTTKGVSTLFSYFDGVVESSSTCKSVEKTQVEYTIKRLKLDTHRLENNRIQKIRDIRDALIGLTEEKQKEFVRVLLDESQSVLHPYFSTIKDNFGFMLL